MNHIFDFFIGPYQGRELSLILLEGAAFFFGIVSVIYAKKEDILVYPTGLVATVLTTYLFFLDELFGDMMMNFYFSIMSIYGWWNWLRVKKGNEKVVKISRTSINEKLIGFGEHMVHSCTIKFLVMECFEVVRKWRGDDTCPAPYPLA